MTLQKEYDAWHSRLIGSGDAFEVAASPWYGLVREALGSIVGMRILEVACGRCGFVRELAGAGARVTGCDFSWVALCAGRSKLLESGTGELLVQGDAQRLPFADASFDLVISCETIEHVPDVTSALQEMHRVSRSGARLLLTTPNYLNFMGLYELYSILRHPDRRSDQPFDRRQWFLQIRNWVRRAGWTIQSSDGTVHQFPIVPGRNPVRIQSLERNRTVRRLLSPFALHYFVVGQKT